MELCYIYYVGISRKSHSADNTLELQCIKINSSQPDDKHSKPHIKIVWHVDKRYAINFRLAKN